MSVDQMPPNMSVFTNCALCDLPSNCQYEWQHKEEDRVLFLCNECAESTARLLIEE